jgi:hypothetical protein
VTDTPSEMLVMFTSNSSFFPAQVKLGSSPFDLCTVFNGSSNAPYTVDGSLHMTNRIHGLDSSCIALNTDMCFSPANDSVLFLNPGYQHQVLLTNLQPGSVLCMHHHALSSHRHLTGFYLHTSDPSTSTSLVASTLSASLCGATP